MSCPPPTGKDKSLTGDDWRRLDLGRLLFILFRNWLRDVCSRLKSRKTKSGLKRAPEDACLILAGPDAAIGPTQNWRGTQRKYYRRTINLSFEAGPLGSGRQGEIQGLVDNDGIGASDCIVDLPAIDVRFE